MKKRFFAAVLGLVFLAGCTPAKDNPSGSSSNFVQSESSSSTAEQESSDMSSMESMISSEQESSFVPSENTGWDADPSDPDIPETSSTAPRPNVGYHTDKVTISSSVKFEIKVPERGLKTVSAADFGMSAEKSDNTDGLLTALNHCRLNPGTKLVIPKGTYQFSSSVPNELVGAEDVIIDGQGSTFVFQNQYMWLKFTDCKRVEVKNINIDWNWEKSRLASVVKVIATGENTVDLEFPECETIPSTVTFFDFNRMSGDKLENLTPGSEVNLAIWGNQTGITKQEKIGNNKMRLTYKSKLDALSVGEYYLVRHYSYGSDAFVVSGCSDFTARNINIWSSAGMAFKATSSTHHYQFLDCSVKIKPGSDRHISATADCLHIVNTLGNGRIEDCTFESSGDDCINIHDNVGELNNRLVGNSILARRLSAEPGDTITFYSADYKPIGFSAKVTEVKDEGNYIKKVTFDKEVPKTAKKGCILFNSRYNSSNYLIKNNRFGSNRARGTLLGSSNGLVEGNTYYRTQGAAILVVADIHESWCEGTGVDGLVVRNNTFEECNVSDWTPLINIAALNKGGTVNAAVFKNLIFENNLFKNFPSQPFGVQSSSDVVIRGNRFVNDKPHGSNNPKRGMINVQNAKNVQIIGNTWENSAYMSFGKQEECVDIIGVGLNTVIKDNIVK